MSEIPLKSKKMTIKPWNLKNDKNTLKPKKKALMDIDFLWTKMEGGHQTLFQITVNEE